MARVALTLRIDAEEHTALENLSKVEGRPIDQLIDEAIRNYLSRHEARQTGLREYRMRDPELQRAIDAFVDAEASFEDVLEGEPIRGELIDGQFKPAGPYKAGFEIF